MKSKILIVEDTAAVREEISDILMMEGFDVFEAKNGLDGLSQIKNINPNLILTDIVMPEMNGFELYEAIQKDTGINKIPVIFLSAKADKDAVERAKKMGSGDYIIKPVSPDKLINKIKKRINIE
ncbi:MAG: response regulator [Bacteroidetes bacterium]|nr:MAG: response regulator [Bacteroidota bacterium]